MGLAVSEHKVLGFLVFLLLALGVVCVLSLVPGLGWTAHSFSALLLWKVACVLAQALNGGRRKGYKKKQYFIAVPGKFSLVGEIYRHIVTP